MRLVVTLAFAVVRTLGPTTLSAEQLGLPSIPASERSALLALYSATDGPHWLNKEGWGGPVGTECEWEGVLCDYMGSGAIVVGLHLGANRLTGVLPRELDLLPNLKELLLYDNKLSGRVPKGVLAKFDSGRLRFLGYATQFSSISAIKLELRPVGVLCGGYRAAIAPDGATTLERKYCRHASDEDRGTFWERSVGFIDRYSGDFDRLARLAETLQLERISGKYDRAITHGTYETITIQRAGHGSIVIEDYSDSAPAQAWLMRRAIAGAIFNASWEKTERSEVVIE